MEVNDTLINKLAHLSRLHISDDEREELKGDLKKMIAFVEKLGELDLEHVKPLVHISDEVNVFREDEVKGSISTEQALRNAPLHDGKYFKVPKVIRK